MAHGGVTEFSSRAETIPAFFYCNSPERLEGMMLQFSAVTVKRWPQK